MQRSNITNVIKSLKNGKSCGLSLILNEMLNYGQLYVMPLIHKLFNLVFTNGIYPKSWSIGYITPLHQSGSVYDPSNYRRITIGDCLGQITTRFAIFKGFYYLKFRYGKLIH
jgi:hypothetical protein